MNEVIVFDLGGTLLSGDSTKSWLLEQLKSNTLRFIGAIVVMPIAFPLMKFNKLKSLGASLFLWVATYGLNENKLEENFNSFAINLKNNLIPNLYWFKDGLSVLNTHLYECNHVIIVTASPEPLAKALFKSIGLDVKVIGTPLKKQMNAWVGSAHCRHIEKLKRLQLIGINPQWYATYSDDPDEDDPILRGGQLAYLINNSQKKRLKKGLEHIVYLDWD